MEISEAHYISLTTDIWTATTNNTPFLSLTGHWLDGHFNQHEAILKVMPFIGSHTGQRIGEHLIKGLKEMEIPLYKVHLFLRDNAANMVKGLRKNGLESIGCFIHTLQLCLTDTIFCQSSVIDILAKCRKSATHFHHSPLAESKFRAIQERLKLVPHKLQQDITTRWNSPFYMLQKYLEQKQAIVLFASEYPDDGVATFSNMQWDIIKKLVELLSPFEEITKEFSLRQTTISTIIPTILTLKIFLKNSEAQLTFVKTTVGALNKAIIYRFDHFLTNKNCCLATFLDPRYKLTPQVKEIDESKVINWIIEYLNVEKEIKATSDTETDSLNSSSNNCEIEFTGFQKVLTPMNWKNCFELMKGTNASKQITEISTENLLSDSEGVDVNIPSNLVSRKDSNSKQKKQKSKIEAEVHQYLLIPILKSNSDPFLFWKKNADTFPILQKAALKYLSAPPSSVERERLFSIGGKVYKPDRNKLSPENAEILMFLHYNLRIYNFDY